MPIDKCNKNLTFEEKELELLRKSVDIAETKLGKKIKQNNDVDSMIKIVEDFMRRKKVVCYGGTAINNILPENDQFYNNDVEIPDYDFFSPKSIDHAKELADIYASKGYDEVEVRSGVHKETYKVFVNFIPIADITQLEPKIFKVLYKNTIRKNGISYAPPDYLRMLTYNELSRPDGDVSRWEKVYKRLILLNKHYPLKTTPKCSQVNFMRDFTGNPELKETLYNVVREAMIDEGVVFIGGYASSLYGRHMPAEQKKQLQHVPDFDVLATDPKAVAYIIKERLEDAGFKNVKVNKKQATGDDAIMTHYEIVVDDDTLCFIYEPYGCYSYNTIKVNNKTVKVATIETMLLFLLAFMYADRPYYDHERIICMAEYLINVQAKNRLEQKGLLKRFNVNCYGKEKTLVEIRGEKASKYKELKNAQDSKEYNKYFFKYIPNKANKANKANIEKNDSFQSDDRSSEDKYSNKKNKNISHKNKKYATRHRPFKNNKRTRKNNVVRKMFGNIF
jgi:hypothetical protein